MTSQQSSEEETYGISQSQALGMSCWDNDVHVALITQDLMEQEQRLLREIQQSKQKEAVQRDATVKVRVEIFAASPQGQAVQVGYHPDPLDKTRPSRRPPARQAQLVVQGADKHRGSPKSAVTTAPASHNATTLPPPNARPISPLPEQYVEPSLDPLLPEEITKVQDETAAVYKDINTQELDVASELVLPEIEPTDQILILNNLRAPTPYVQITPPIMVLQPSMLEVIHDFEMGGSLHVDKILKQPDAPTQDASWKSAREQLVRSCTFVLQHDEPEHDKISAGVESLDIGTAAGTLVPIDTAVVERMAEVTCEAPVSVPGPQIPVEVNTQDVFGPRNAWPVPEPSLPPVSLDATVEPDLAPTLQENDPEDPYFLPEAPSNEHDNSSGPVVEPGSVADLLPAAALSREAEPAAEVGKAAGQSDEHRCSGKITPPEDTRPAPLVPETNTPVVVARSTTNSYFVERSAVTPQTDHNPRMAPDSHARDPSAPVAVQKPCAVQEHVPEAARRCVSTPPSVGDRTMAMASKEDYSKVASRFKESKAAFSLKGSGPQGVLLSWDKNGRSTGGSTSVYWPLNSPAVDPQSDGSSCLTFADLCGASELHSEAPQHLTGHASWSPHLGGAGMTSRLSTAGRTSRLPLRPLFWTPDKGVDSAETVSSVVRMSYSDSGHADVRVLEAYDAQIGMSESHHRKDSWSGNSSAALEVFERRTGGSSAHMMLPSSPDLSKARAYTPSSLVGLPLIRKGRHSTSSPVVGLAITEAMTKKTTAAALAPLCVTPMHVMQARDLPYTYAPQHESVTHDTLKPEAMIWGIEEGAEVSDSLDWWDRTRSSVCSSSQQSEAFSTPDTSQSLRALKLTMDSSTSAALSAHDGLYSSSPVATYFPPLDIRQRPETSSNFTGMNQLLIPREDSPQARLKGMPSFPVKNASAIIQQPHLDQQQLPLPQHEQPKESSAGSKRQSKNLRRSSFILPHVLGVGPMIRPQISPVFTSVQTTGQHKGFYAEAGTRPTPITRPKDTQDAFKSGYEEMLTAPRSISFESVSTTSLFRRSMMAASACGIKPGSSIGSRQIQHPMQLNSTARTRLSLAGEQR